MAKKKYPAVEVLITFYHPIYHCGEGEYRCKDCDTPLMPWEYMEKHLIVQHKLDDVEASNVMYDATKNPLPGSYTKEDFWKNMNDSFKRMVNNYTKKEKLRKWIIPIN